MWTREVPKTDGYYWVKAFKNAIKNKDTYDAEVARLRFSWVDICGDEVGNPPYLYLWYDEPLRFVPPPFTSDDAVRLGVTGE